MWELLKVSNDFLFSIKRLSFLHSSFQGKLFIAIKEFEELYELKKY